MSNAETNYEENTAKKETCSKQTCKGKTCKKTGNATCKCKTRKIDKQSEVGDKS